MAKNDLQGTLDLLVLKTLAQVGSLHGYGIVPHIQRVSDELLNVEEGSLYPALHRIEQNGWIASQWALTETGRKAILPAHPTGPAPARARRKELRTAGERRPRGSALRIREEQCLHSTALPISCAARVSLDHEIDAELRAHIDLRTEAHIAAGMDPSEARRKALLQFGSRAATQERVAAADSFLLFASIGSGRVSRGELSPRAEAELSASGKIAFSESLLHQNALIRTEATPADCLANCNGARKAASATLE